MECEISTSPGDPVLGCSLELGIASLALPLEIDDDWLATTYLSKLEREIHRYL